MQFDWYYIYFIQIVAYKKAAALSSDNLRRLQKFQKISHFFLTLVVTKYIRNFKIGTFFSNFVAFSQYLNFKTGFMTRILYLDSDVRRVISKNCQCNSRNINAVNKVAHTCPKFMSFLSPWVVVMSPSWNFLARAEPSYEGAEPSRAEAL